MQKQAVQSSGDVQDDKKTVDTMQVDPLSSILKQDSLSVLRDRSDRFGNMPVRSSSVPPRSGHIGCLESAKLR